MQGSSSICIVYKRDVVSIVMSSNQVILMAKFCSVVQLLAVVTCHLAHVQSSPVLYFSIMVSDGLISLNTTSVLPAVEQEVQSINSDTCTLPGYNLQYNIYRLHEVRD